MNNSESEKGQRMLMTLDIGNTVVKVAIYDGERRVASVSGSTGSGEAVRTMLTLYSVDGIVACIVGNDKDGLLERLKQDSEIPVLVVDADTKVPFSVEYDRMTLGNDRLAGIAGVVQGGSSVLLADAGTALTLDLATGMNYRGGNISPGMDMRFKALHNNTSLLPMVDGDGVTPVWGHNTQEAIRSGVVRGMALEIAGAWRQACEIDKNTRLVITGGDAKLLSRYLMTLGVQHDIDSDAVERGLVRIYNYNNDNNNNNE